MSTSTSSTAEVDAVMRRAETAAPLIAALSPRERAETMAAVAAALEKHAEELIGLAATESHLGEARLTGELGRTVFQFRFLAERVRRGEPLGVTIDHPDPAWGPGPRPDLRRMLRPIGPVVIFEASNFPFAFGAAGTDTASAMAAGCPIVVKAHPAHPMLTARIGEIVLEALGRRAHPAGGFAVIGGEDAGRQAVMHPATAAGAFTGSLRGGRALYDLATSRPDPIPFYAEMGSVNPVFVTESAARERGETIWAQYVEAFSAHAGQLCTKPGVIVVPAAAFDAAQIAVLLEAAPTCPMLSEQIERGFTGGLERLLRVPGVEVLPTRPEATAPTLVHVPITAVLADPVRLLEEVFGPASLVVTYDDEEEMVGLANALTGQLTATVHGNEEDITRRLISTLELRVGRVILNGWPTGVSVTDAMHHGGPYPATTLPTGSVGTEAVARFLRPVSYQSVPDALLPPALRDDNPWGVVRRIDGRVQLADDTRTGGIA